MSGPGDRATKRRKLRESTRSRPAEDHGVAPTRVDFSPNRAPRLRCAPAGVPVVRRGLPPSLWYACIAYASMPASRVFHMGRMSVAQRRRFQKLVRR